MGNVPIRCSPGQTRSLRSGRAGPPTISAARTTKRKSLTSSREIIRDAKGAKEVSYMVQVD